MIRGTSLDLATKCAFKSEMAKHNTKVNGYHTDNKQFTNLGFKQEVKNAIRKLPIIRLVLIDKIESLKDILEK